MAHFIEYLRARAFNDLSVEGHEIDLQGWVDNKIFDALHMIVNHFRAHGLQEIAAMEVGVWKGKSIDRVIRELQTLNMPLKHFIAIDTWLGAPEFYTWGLNDPTRGESMKFINGYPTVFFTFTKNMKKLGHDSVVAPFPMSSVQAADILNHYGIKSDLIYIDASHEYEAVLEDIKKFMLCLSQHGVMWGDDYIAWAGVRRAVDEFVTRNSQFVLNTFGEVWVLRKK